MRSEEVGFQYICPGLALVQTSTVLLAFKYVVACLATWLLCLTFSAPSQMTDVRWGHHLERTFTRVQKEGDHAYYCEFVSLHALCCVLFCTE